MTLGTMTSDVEQRIDFALLITHILPLAERERGFGLARSGEATRAVLTPQEGRSKKGNYP